MGGGEGGVLFTLYVKIASQWTELVSGMTSISVNHGRKSRLMELTSLLPDVTELSVLI